MHRVFLLSPGPVQGRAFGVPQAVRLVNFTANPSRLSRSGTGVTCANNVRFAVIIAAMAIAGRRGAGRGLSACQSFRCVSHLMHACAQSGVSFAY
ncbi:MAG: hypothetical protein CBB77_06790 [Hyphomonas sp. TMED17]|nr:MAG: hypothetical protein CBB77_06790 [Hyphomonas sp. TMED17]